MVVLRMLVQEPIGQVPVSPYGGSWRHHALDALESDQLLVGNDLQMAPTCTRVNWVPFVLLAFFPFFFGVFLPQKSFLNAVFWELKWGIWGSKTQPLEMPSKPWETSQHHNWPRCMHWPQLNCGKIAHRWHLPNTFRP